MSSFLDVVPVRVHPCGEALKALREAGHRPEVVRSYGLGPLPGLINDLTPRREVKRLTGTYWVPVLVADVKGDVSGLSTPGASAGPAVQRAADLGLTFTPTAFLVLIGVVQGISPTMEEASHTLRASPGRNLGIDYLPGALDLDVKAFAVEPEPGRERQLEAATEVFAAVRKMYGELATRSAS